MFFVSAAIYRARVDRRGWLPLRTAKRVLFVKRAKFQAVHPVLPARDVQALTRFYVVLLGFELLFQDSVDDPRYAGIGRGSVNLHLQWQAPESWEAVERPFLRFVVSDVEALFEEYKGQGVFHANTAIRDTAWGTREFAFFDPDQNGLTFYRDL